MCYLETVFNIWLPLGISWEWLSTNVLVPGAGILNHNIWQWFLISGFEKNADNSLDKREKKSNLFFFYETEIQRRPITNMRKSSHNLCGHVVIRQRLEYVTTREMQRKIEENNEEDSWRQKQTWCRSQHVEEHGHPCQLGKTLDDDVYVFYARNCSHQHKHWSRFVVWSSYLENVSLYSVHLYISLFTISD